MNNRELEEQKKQLSIEIEKLRQRINLLVVREGLDSPDILALGKQLDELVVKYLILR